ncbi:NADPh quinone reductase [Thoreauomyces humboldtii]|nr:NADPh quinone reductase [Thoreauomyces humboldtii]
MSTYKAAQFKAYGGPEQIELADLPIPSVGPLDVLIKVHAASINPIDWKRCGGDMKMMIPDTFPLRTGYDVSGTVEAVGTSVTQFKIGDEVYSRVGEEMGTIAELVITQEEKLALKPKSISHEQAAGIPLAGLTAYQALEKTGLKDRGTPWRLFVPGGAGGVASFAIQFAKRLFGATEVVSTASEPKIELVLSLGADSVLDYKKGNVYEGLSEFDFAYDTVGEVQRQLAIVKKGGFVYTIAAAPSGAEMAALAPQIGFMMKTILNVVSARVRWGASSKGLNYGFFVMHPSGKDLAHIAQLVDDPTSNFKVLIDSTHPFTLEGVRAAFARSKTGRSTGKVIIKVI